MIISLPVENLRLMNMFFSYGSTENMGGATRTWWGDHKAAGTVGPPHPCAEIKLVDVPSMGYFAEDKPNPRGEIYVRGDHCFREYYKGINESMSR
jgi:long-chain acyl-CoA synthetase